MRLDKLLAKSAGLSRTEAKAAIKAGRVDVDGICLTQADAQVAEDAALALDGQLLVIKTHWHLMLNKPVGLLTAARDSRQGTVMDLLPQHLLALKCMPVGRLDKDTEGLLLFTTDGELAHRLLSPKRQVNKVYTAQVAGQLDEHDVASFAQGITLSDFTALPSQMKILEANENTSLARVILQEGKHRQVRRMFGSLGHEVLNLRREQFGPLALDANLSIGTWRELNEAEELALKEAVDLG